MMTQREAQTRAVYYNGTIRWDRTWQEFCVTLNEWSRYEVGEKAYHTTDIEDAVLTLGLMRRREKEMPQYVRK